MKRNLFPWLLAIAFLLVNPWTSRAVDTFSFAGYTFNQLYTPDRANLLGNSTVLGGATFSAGVPSSATSPINFPGGTGFNTSLCLAPLAGLSTNSVRAINLPLGNDGTVTRHGVEVYWSNSRVLLNSTNADFVIYESGSLSNAVEGVMARAHYGTNWTEWYYFAPDANQTTTSPEVLFSYGFELSDMGVPTNSAVDRLQLANLTQSDRISTTNAIDIGGGIFVGEGRVVFDGSSTVYPDAGVMASSRRFTSTTYDPDPLYVAALHEACEFASPTLSVIASTNSITLSWPAPTCYSLQTTTNLLSTNTIWGTPDETVVFTNSHMTTIVTTTNAQRFYRLYKP